MADLNQVHQLLGEVKALTEGVDKKLDRLDDRFTAHETEDSKRFRGVHERVDKVSSKQSWILGACSVVAAIFGAAVTFTVAWARSKF